MSNSDSKLHVYDDTNKVWKKALATSSGVLKCDTSINTAGLATDTLQTAGNASLSSIDGKITACDTGSVTVASSALPTGASTSANQVTANGHLSTLAGAVVGSEVQVDIVSAPTLSTSDSVAQGSLSTIAGAVAGSEMQVDIVSSTALSVNDVTSQGHLSTLAGAVVGSEGQVDIVSAPSLTVSDATAQASLSSIDTKITACDTGSVTVASSALPTGGATSALQTAGNASLTELEGALYADGDAITATDKGILCMGKDNSGQAHDIRITSNGDVEVEIADFVKGQAVMASSFPVVLASDQTQLKVIQSDVTNVGSFENLASNETITAGSVGTGTVNVSDMRDGNLFYSDTSTSSFDTVDIEASVDSGTNWFKYLTIYPSNMGSGSTRDATETRMSLAGITTLRLRNTSSTDTYSGVDCTVVGSP